MLNYGRHINIFAIDCMWCLRILSLREIIYVWNININIIKWNKLVITIYDGLRRTYLPSLWAPSSIESKNLCPLQFLWNHYEMDLLNSSVRGSRDWNEKIENEANTIPPFVHKKLMSILSSLPGMKNQKSVRIDAKGVPKRT